MDQVWIIVDLSINIFGTFFRDNNIDECGLDMFFSADFEVLGKIEEVELKPGGKEIAVCEENKLEYLT